jgi:hypothetical protein
MTTATPGKYAAIYRRFEAAVTRYDCGRHCAPLNGGEPVCCSTQSAVPVAHRAEFKLLQGRGDLWHRFKPYDAATRRIVAELPKTCVAIECRGARSCERDNRSMSCRAFPFFPYITRAGEFIGLAYYWDFEDRCWVISNLGVVERGFVREFVAAFEDLFKFDPDDYDAFKEHSASIRRVFSRWRRPIPLIGRDGGYFKVLPHGGDVVPAKVEDFKAHGPYRSPSAYARAVREAASA